MGEYLLDGTQRLFGAEAGVGNSLMDFPGFARHQIALKCNSMRGVYERQTVYRGIQERSG